MKISRHIMAFEVEDCDAKDFISDLRFFMRIKAPDVKFAIHPVVLEDELDGRTDKTS